MISIHAPRTGSDPPRGTNEAAEWHFNPRSPHGERPLGRRERPKTATKFQSTLPARGATCSRGSKLRSIADISIHAPRTGSDEAHKKRAHRAKYFNPRSPHGERLDRETAVWFSPQFQSTLPARGATAAKCGWNSTSPFQSTLPARGATKPTATLWRVSHRHFNPRSPHGERQRSRRNFRNSWKHFNPRSPHGERRYRLRLRRT